MLFSSEQDKPVEGNYCKSCIVTTETKSQVTFGILFFPFLNPIRIRGNHFYMSSFGKHDCLKLQKGTEGNSNTFCTE
jgi:hypothetical protein